MESKSEICLLCLKNNHEDKSLTFFDLSTEEWDNVTYLSKLQYVLNEEIMIYETTLICNICLNELNKAYDFKERVLGALDYWSGKLDESVNIVSKYNEDDTTEFNGSSEDIVKTDISIEEHNLFDSPIDVECNANEGSELNECATFPCSRCGELFSEAYELIHHRCTSLLHLDSPIDVECNANEGSELNECATFPCNRCGELFSEAYELIHHRCTSQKTNKKSAVQKTKSRKRLKNEKAGSFQCDFCELLYTEKWKLNKHLRETHTVDRKYVCTFCNRAFKQSYPLRAHLATHTGERNYNCSICGKTFQHLSSQSRHMRSHSALPGKKAKKSPFLCNICGKSFPYSNVVQRHMRIHTGDKHYECKICNRKFNQSTHLHVHLRTHTGERPYMCSICGQSFSIKATLDKHMNRHKDSKNDTKTFQNLSQSENRDSSAEKRKSEVIVIEDIQVYDHEYMNTCSE